MESLVQLRHFRQSLPATALADDAVREAMMAEARKLLLALERPQNVIARIGFQQMESVACSIAIKTGLFKALKEKSPRTTAELVKFTGADPLLLAYGAVEQGSSDVFRSNMVSDTLARPTSEAAIEWDLEFHGRGWPLVPEFLQKNGWKNFTGGTDTPLTAAWNMPSRSSMFEALKESPHLDAFNTYMTVFDEGHRPWTDFYPVNDRIVKGLKADDANSVTMLDVGGGLGHQTVKFKKAFDLPGRHVVQDFAHTFPPDGERLPGVEYMVHDFNQEQPANTRGARLIYMRYVPHDWSQEACVHLCTQLRQAMTPGYSILIVNEWIVPDVEPSMLMASMDLTMMAASGGMERTERLHREYLERAGLTVTGVYRAGDNVSEGVIEAMLLE